jgi:hypothetical protein
MAVIDFLKRNDIRIFLLEERQDIVHQIAALPDI